MRPVHVFDAHDFGMHPTNSGIKNQRALQAMIDGATDGSIVEIRIPATGTYEITSDVSVAPANDHGSTSEELKGRDS
jgi:hypothetical protein